MENNRVELNVDASKNFGVFCARQHVCGLGEDVPEEYHHRQVVVKFQSGLKLDCLGRDVARFAAGRT